MKTKSHNPVVKTAITQAIIQYYQTGNQQLLTGIKTLLNQFDISQDLSVFYSACGYSNATSPVAMNQRKFDVLNALLDSLPEGRPLQNAMTSDRVFSASTHPSEQVYKQCGGGVLHWLLNFSMNKAQDGIKPEEVASNYIKKLYTKAINKGASALVQDMFGKTILHWTAQYDMPTLTKSLVTICKQSLTDKADSNGLYPEHEALLTYSADSFHAIADQTEIVHKVPTSVVSQFDQLLTTYLSSNGFTEGTGNLHQINGQQLTPLSLAVVFLGNIHAQPEQTRGSLETNMYKIMFALLNKPGFQVDGVESTGATALMYATKLGANIAARILLDHGANLLAADNGGSTAARWAVNGFNQNPNKTLELLHKAAEKMGAGMSACLFSIADKSSLTPLHVAMILSPNSVEKLLDLGADVNSLFGSYNSLDLTTIDIQLNGKSLDPEKKLPIQKALISHGAKFSSMVKFEQLPNYTQLKRLMDDYDTRHSSAPSTSSNILETVVAAGQELDGLEAALAGANLADTHTSDNV